MPPVATEWAQTELVRVTCLYVATELRDITNTL